MATTASPHYERDRYGFGDLGGRIWLNCAHQGPLPRVAAEEAREAVRWKTAPHELTQERFDSAPQRLRAALGRLIHAPPEQIVLGNGASYGLHLLANGLPLGEGDEVLLMQGDFPSNLMPWLGLEKRGVRVRLLEPRHFLLTADEVAPEIGPRTRVLCLSWVHSFSGVRADLAELGTLCRSRGVRFVVNTTQGLGARPLDVSQLPVDALSNAGWKWLCGPYGTGFCWLRPELLGELDYNQSYWLSLLKAEDLGREELDVRVPESAGARRYDVFSTANFFNFKPWAAALEHLLAIGLERIASRDSALVSHLLERLDDNRFEISSPRDEERRSTLVFVTHRDKSRNPALHARLRDAGVDVALRRGSLRFSPHLYNTEADIERALEVLHHET